MNRIEEIKKQAAHDGYVRRDIDYFEAQEDIQYLLAKLEIAERALEGCVELGECQLDYGAAPHAGIDGGPQKTSKVKQTCRDCETGIQG